jgi:cysteine desulfuration protein SufE
MTSGTALPPPLADLVADFEFVDRGLRAEMLVEYADRFAEPPADVAIRPFPPEARVPRCESEAYVFAAARPDGTLDFHFAVENPQGVSARAWAVILAATLSGQPLGAVAAVPDETLGRVFGPDLTPLKHEGMRAMLGRVRDLARAAAAG